MKDTWMAYDHTLGKEIHDLLQAHQIETPCHFNAGWAFGEVRDSFRNILKCLGLNTEDPSLRETPDRIMKMFCYEIFEGLDYGKFPACTTFPNPSHRALEQGGEYDEMISGTASVMSMCEHHFVPFQGTAFLAYIPATKIVGLSKLNRVVDFFSRRPQVQERLTMQISVALQHILKTPDIAVVLRCEHLCVKMRGIKDQNSLTVTSSMQGRFRQNQALREEFLALTR